MTRKLLLLFPVAIALGMALSFTSLLNPSVRQGSVLPVLAANCSHPANYNCGFGTTRTSGLSVNHVDGSGGSVTPNGSTNWNITAQWCPTLPGAEVTETATCTVTWNGSAWSLTNVNLTNNITAITLCTTTTCQSANSVGYMLLVQLNDPLAPGGQNLSLVTYATTSVPNGNKCLGGSSVSPTSQSFSATDTVSSGDSNRCAYSCSYGGSGLMSITYN